MTDSAEHPDSHPDSGSVTHPVAEATSDISSPDVAVFLSKETTTTTVVSGAAEDDTHVKNTVTITETHLKAVAPPNTDGDLLSPVGGDSNEDELTIEDLLRQAGWESRGPSTRPVATVKPGDRAVGVPSSPKKTANPANSTDRKNPANSTDSKNPPQSADNKNPPKPTKAPPAPPRRDTGPPAPGTSRGH